MEKVLKGKVAILTGACGGLGLSFSEALLSEGAQVVLTDVSEAMMKSAEEKLAKLYPDQYKICKMNVASLNSIQDCMKKINDEYGHIDILVNVAGGSLYTPKELDKITENDWQKVLDINLKGTFFCCQTVVPYMKAHGGGKIINTSSIGGRTASLVTGCAYAAAKGGVIALTRRLALEVGPYNINVNAIAPGTILSGDRMIELWNELSEEQKKANLSSIPLGRLSTAEEQASVIVFLASDMSSFMTGTVIDVNGGRLMA